MSEIVRSCPMLPKVGIDGKSWQRLAKDGKSWQKLSKVVKSCQKFAQVGTNLQKNSIFGIFGKRCQKLAKIAEKMPQDDKSGQTS